MSSLLTTLRENFWHIAPILAAGAIALAIGLERAVALLIRYPMPAFGVFFERLGDLVMANRISEAIALCEKYRKKPAAMIAKEGLLRAHQPEELIEHGLEYSVAECVERIQKRTQFLSTIANVATLLGLFGTIAGLIQSFAAVGAATPQARSALLAAGISTAMNATMLGLAVAIPCMVAFSFLTNRANRLLSESEKAAIRTIDILKQRAYAIENENHRSGSVLRRTS